jgi:AraC-like DNA-binding protein
VEFKRSTVLPGLEARRSCQDNPCYRPHAHESFSIGLIDRGTSVLTGPLSGPIELREGDVIVIPAGQVHACNPHEGRWRYRMIHLAPALVGEFAGDFAGKFAWDCPGGFEGEPAGDSAGRPHVWEPATGGISVLRRPDLTLLIAALGDLVFAEAPAADLERAFGAAFQLLAAAAPVFSVPSSTDVRLLESLRPVLLRLRDDDRNPDLADLATLVGMDRYGLSRAVKRATGLSPLAWRQNARIVRARHMLDHGMPIAEVAHSLGFSDQSHFHRVFRSHVAATPGHYRG